MPSDITTPKPAGAIDRLVLTTETARGTGPSTFQCAAVMCPCFADDAE